MMLYVRAKRQPEVIGDISYVTPVYQARTEVGEREDESRTFVEVSCETWTSPPVCCDGNTITNVANASDEL